MDNRFFWNIDESEVSILKLEFEKFIKLSSHAVNDIRKYWKLRKVGEEYLRSMTDLLYRKRIIQDSLYNQIYSGELDGEEIIFLLLEAFLIYAGIFSEISETPRVSRAVAISNYKALADLLDKNSIFDFESNEAVNDSEEDSIIHDLENSTLEILAIFLANCHSYISRTYSSDNNTRLWDYANLLCRMQIIDKDELIQMISVEDIETLLYPILRDRVFWKDSKSEGLRFDETHYLFECFCEYEEKYKKRLLHSLQRSISDTALRSLEVWEEINPRLVEIIIEALLDENQDAFDKEEIIALLEEWGFLSQREKNYLKTMESQRDIAFYTARIFIQKVLFTCKLTPKQESDFYTAYETFTSTIWNSYFRNTLRWKKQQEKIDKPSEKLIHILLRNNWENLSQDFLNDFLLVLQQHFPYKPFYLHILHIEFDELLELTLPFHKAIQILGILVCDIFPISHPLFEDASELLLCNTRDRNNHAAILRIIQEKREETTFSRGNKK